MSETLTVTEQSPDPMLGRWTDDQESALLRAVVNWKPAGMHKHFRMVGIRDYILTSGVASIEDEHISTSGIWKKLSTLYDLDKLDEREDSVMSDGTNDKDETVPYWREFELPRDDFEEMMWDRRLAPEGNSSPEMSRRESTVADTDEPRSSPVSNRGTGKSNRASARKSGRLSKLQNELDTERSSRRTSKTGSLVDVPAEEDQHMEDVGAEEEEGDGSETAEEDDDNEEEGDKKGVGKRSTRGTQRAKAARKGRRRG